MNRVMKEYDNQRSPCENDELSDLRRRGIRSENGSVSQAVPVSENARASERGMLGQDERRCRYVQGVPACGGG